MHVGGFRSTWVTRQPQEAYNVDCLQPKFARLDHCMIWGSICHSSKSDLVFWDKKVWGNINSTTYQQHILPSLRDFYELMRDTSPPELPDVLVMQDNALPHKAKTTIAWLQDERISLLDWPASSPDLNPIENVWALMKERINRRRPRPATLETMRVAIQEEWDAISPTEIDSYISSMPRRVQAVIAMRGGHINY